MMFLEYKLHYCYSCVTLALSESNSRPQSSSFTRFKMSFSRPRDLKRLTPLDKVLKKFHMGRFRPGVEALTLYTSFLAEKVALISSKEYGLHLYA